MMPLHNLPPRDYERFVGRQSELAEVRRLLGPRSRAFVITIDGIGGIGKSALALEAAYAWAETYTTIAETERFEAIVWVSAKRSYLTADGILERRQAFRTLSDVYAAIAQVLDFPAITRARAEEQRAIVEQVLGEQRTLLILDNLETVDDEELMVFLRELPNPTKALVTTRHRIDVAHPVRLTGMPHQDALALIEQEAIRKEVAVTADDREQLWQRTGGVPLAIVWSMGLMGLGGSVESVLRRLGSGQSDIARFCFEESISQIRGQDAYRLLLALSLFVSDASREALGVVAGLGEDEFGRDNGLEELLKLSLVNKSSDRFNLLPLTRSYALEELSNHSNWYENAYERLKAYLFGLIETYGGWSVDWEGVDRLEHDLPTILVILDRVRAQLKYIPDPGGQRVLSSDSNAQARHLIHLIGNVARTCRTRGYWNESEKLHLQAMQLARETGDHLALAWSCFGVTHLYYNWHETNVAHQYAQEMRAAADQAGDDWAMCLADRQLAIAEFRLGNLERAQEVLDKAFDRCMRLGDPLLRRHFLGVLGDLALRRGHYDIARQWYSEAVAIFRTRNDLSNVASSLRRLGRLAFYQGNDAEALFLLQEGLAAAEQSRRINMVAGTSLLLAEIAAKQGRKSDCLSLAEKADNLFLRLGMKREQAEAEALLRQFGAQLS